MEFVRIGGADGQYAEPGILWTAGAERRPSAIPASDLVIGADTGPGAVMPVIFRRRGPVGMEVFLATCVNSAIHGLWVPTPDMATNETFDAALARFCADYLGCRVPKMARPRRLTFQLVQVRRMPRAEHPQSLVVVFFDLLWRKDWPELRVNMTAEGRPSAHTFFADAQWVPLQTALVRDRGLPEPLVEALGKLNDRLNE